MKIIVSIAILLISNVLTSQINQFGVPIVTNYSMEEYNGSEQNWAIAQDKRGIIYFGNNDKGVLEYDGVSWRKIPIKNTIVRSLAIDHNNILYIGGVNEIGMLTTEKNGNNKYISFMPLVDSSKNTFSDVWKTHYHDSSICFVSEKYLFKYKDSNLEQYELPPGIVFSFKIENNLYMPSYNNGLLKFESLKCKAVKGGRFYAQKGVYTINKFNNKLLMGTSPDGLFYYDLKNSHETINNNLLQKLAKENQVYSSTIINNQSLVLGTLFGGAINIDHNNNIDVHLNKNFGLQDETIIDLSTDNIGNVWLALNNGISKAEFSSGIKHLGQETGFSGNVLDICSFNNKLFIATSAGVFFESVDADGYVKFKKIEGINGQTNKLLPVSSELLVGNIFGLYIISNDFSLRYVDKEIRHSKKSSKTLYINTLSRSIKNPNIVYIGLYDGMFSILKTNNNWERYQEFELNNRDVRQIFENKSELFISTNLSGIFKFNLNDIDEFKQFTSNNSKIGKGLPFIFQTNNNLYISTSDGIFKYMNNSFEPYKYSNNNNKAFKYSIFKAKKDSKANLWVSAFNKDKKWVEKISIDSNGHFIRDTLLFKRLPREQIDAIFIESDSICWLGCSSGLYSINTDFSFKTNEDYYTLIRKITSKRDTNIFNGTFYSEVNGHRFLTKEQPSSFISELDYYYNDLTFEYAAPYFIEEQKTQYSYKLEGYNKNWSKWSLETKAVFTNLGEGEYTFKAKAKNIYGIESTVGEYKFSIAPPWYRTILAYVVYVILSIGLIILIVKLYTRRLEREKIRLEGIVQERTAEIRKQNELLEEQKTEILEQKEEIESSIHYAQRIQKAIVPNAELAECLLKDYFLLWKPRDIVSGDFWWLGEKDGYVVATAADCTGHGVPGAFMSMLGVSFLNEVVKQQSITSSGEILNRLRDKVKTTLGQNDPNSTSKDGMDMGMLVLDFNNMKAQFSGAYNPLFLYRDGELIEYKATRNPIAIYIKEKPFAENEIELQKGDTLYMFSDGFPDQFGGEKDKKYSTKRFKQYLASIQNEAMKKQHDMLDAEIEDWMKNTNQIDDIIILGIRI